MKAEDLLSERKAGKQVLNVKPGEELALCVEAVGDHIAVVGENRKMLVFPLAEVPEMARGTGVQLQRYKEGGIADARIFLFPNKRPKEDWEPQLQVSPSL